jgi:hypothetical protein
MVVRDAMGAVPAVMAAVPAASGAAVPGARSIRPSDSVRMEVWVRVDFLSTVRASLVTEEASCSKAAQAGARLLAGGWLLAAARP